MMCLYMRVYSLFHEFVVYYFFNILFELILTSAMIILFLFHSNDCDCDFYHDYDYDCNQ